MPEGRRLLIASQPLAEGVPQHVLDLVRLLPDDYEIDVACPRSSTLWSGLEGQPNVRLHAIGKSRRPSPEDAFSFRRIRALVRSADVVHAHSSKAGFLARLAAAVEGKTDACVFTPHGWSFWAGAGPEAWIYRGLERLAARWCRIIMVVSEAERRAGLEAAVGHESQYRVVHNGVALERFALTRRPVDGRVLMLGRLAPAKNPELTIRAAALVRRRVPGFELHLAGDGPHRARTESLVARLGLERCVRFLGKRDDVPELLSEAACLVLSSRYEGCPLAVLEAMAAGVPVVATRVGGVPELVEHERTGILVEPGSEEELAQGIERLLSDGHLARRLGAEAQRVARQRFSLERMVAEVVALYDEVRGGHAPVPRSE